LLLEAELCFIYETEREAKAVAKAVSPDNVEAPSGLIVETSRSGRRMLASICCEKSLRTFIATLDDILACISVAEKIFKTVKRARKVI